MPRPEESQVSRIRSFVAEHPGSTVARVAKELDIDDMRVAGCLIQQCNKGKMVRFLGSGPRGGFGYYILTPEIRRMIEGKPPQITDPKEPPRTVYSHLLDD